MSEVVTRPPFVDQTILYEPDGPERGNCTEASVASILGLPLEAVPDFRANGSEAYQFWSSFRRFIRSQGYEPLMLPGNHVPDVLYLASGQSSRGVSHMVVMKSGRLVHDPHPSRAGIAAVNNVCILMPQDPARATAMRSLLEVVESETPDDDVERAGYGCSTYMTWGTIDAIRAALTEEQP